MAGAVPAFRAARARRTLLTGTPPAAEVTGGARWLLIGALSVSSLIAALASSAPVASIAPVLMRELDADVTGMAWVLAGYQLTSAGLVLTLGRLADLRGQRLVYGAGWIVFLVGMLAAGAARDIRVLIAARAIAGIGGAAVYAAIPALVTRHAPPGRRGTVLGLQIMLTNLGLTLGPVVGGIAADTVGWRWLFWGVVPLGIVALQVSLRVIPADGPPRRGRFDLVGAALFLGAITAFLVALTLAGQPGASLVELAVLVAVSAALLAWFLQVERRTPSPMLDLGLFRSRAFSSASLAATLNYIQFSAFLVLLPLLLVEGRGLSPSRAALYLTAQALARTIVGPLSGALGDRIGNARLGALGMALAATGSLLLATLGPDASDGIVLLGVVVAGMGSGTFLTPNTSAIMGGTPAAQHGTAAAISSGARSLGLSIGVVVAGSTFTTVAGLDPTQALVRSGVSAGFVVAAAIALLTVAVSLAEVRASRRAAG